MEKDNYISFIIPALNEEDMIESTLRAINRALPINTYEVIVVDNGSNDNTVSVAEAMNATVLVDSEATIAKLRNLGAQEAKGNILTFIDADVTLSSDWYEHLKSAMKQWPEDGLLVTGSVCLAPESSTFVEKHWFSLLSHSETSYINSGHLITTRAMFDRIDGFDTTLRTAEDYDFCHRAKSAGGKVFKQPELRSFHNGFPKTVMQFMSRESWHGKEDFKSVKKFLHSKTAIAATTNFTLLFLLSTSVITGNFIFAFFFLIVVCFLCLSLTYIKFGTHTPDSFFKTAICFELYLLGRIQSIFFKRKRPEARS